MHDNALSRERLHDNGLGAVNRPPFPDFRAIQCTIQKTRGIARMVCDFGIGEAAPPVLEIDSDQAQQAELCQT